MNVFRLQCIYTEQNKNMHVSRNDQIPARLDYIQQSICMCLGIYTNSQIFRDTKENRWKNGGGGTATTVISIKHKSQQRIHMTNEQI